jgi:hypothetical protein
MKIAVLPGDGIGTEIVAEAVKVLDVLDLKFEMESALVGGAAYEAHGHPLPESTLKLAKESDAVLFGAVGDWKYDKLDRPLRPEQAILGLRKNLGLFANFRPAICYEQLVDASSLKPELISGLDILIIRELTGDIYFGQPRGRRIATDGHFPGAEEAFDTMRYSRPEVERIARVAFEAARKRSKRVTSVDKNNVLETSQLWKDVMLDIGKEYPDVELDHMLRRQRGHAAREGAQEVRRGGHRQHVRRHPLGRGRDAHRLDRHAALGIAQFEQPGPVRAQPRQRARHCRQRGCQSFGYNPVRCHDAPLFTQPTRSCRPYRVGGQGRAGLGPAHG